VLFCNAATFKCAAQGYTSANQDSGLTSQGSIDTLCITSCSCINAGTGTQAQCVAAVDEGASCDTAMGPPCLAPARSVTNTDPSGICMVLDATMCM